MSDNLCAGEADGSCKSTGPVASATVTVPVELENSGDYRLLVRPPPNTPGFRFSFLSENNVTHLSLNTMVFSPLHRCHAESRGPSILVLR